MQKLNNSISITQNFIFCVRTLTKTSIYEGRPVSKEWLRTTVGANPPSLRSHARQLVPFPASVRAEFCCWMVVRHCSVTLQNGSAHRKSRQMWECVSVRKWCIMFNRGRTSVLDEDRYRWVESKSWRQNSGKPVFHKFHERSYMK